MSLPCTLEEIINIMPYINHASFVRSGNFCIELRSTHFYPDHLKQLEKMGWIIEDPITIITQPQTQSSPRQQYVQVRLVTKHWQQSNWIRHQIRSKNHDIMTMLKIEVDKIRENTAPFYVPDRIGGD